MLFASCRSLAMMCSETILSRCRRDGLSDDCSEICLLDAAASLVRDFWILTATRFLSAFFPGFSLSIPPPSPPVFTHRSCDIGSTASSDENLECV
jgi:hypothetical protein